MESIIIRSTIKNDNIAGEREIKNFSLGKKFWDFNFSKIEIHHGLYYVSVTPPSCFL